MVYVKGAVRVPFFVLVIHMVDDGKFLLQPCGAKDSATVFSKQTTVF